MTIKAEALALGRVCKAAEPGEFRRTLAFLSCQDGLTWAPAHKLAGVCRHALDLCLTSKLRSVKLLILDLAGRRTMLP